MSAFFEDDDSDYGYEASRGEKPKAYKKILKRAVTLLFFLLFVFVLGLLILRINLSETPKEFRGLTWTSEVLAVKDSEDFEALGQAAYTLMDEDGYYKLDELVLIPAADQVQFTFRYNARSTVGTLMEKYSLTEKPTGEVFVLVLYDNLGREYKEYRFAEKKQFLHEFRRIVFDGVELEGVTSLYLDVYYGGNVSGEDPMHMDFVLWDDEYPTIALTEDEMGKAESSPLTFKDRPAYIDARFDEE